MPSEKPLEEDLQREGLACWWWGQNPNDGGSSNTVTQVTPCNGLANSTTWCCGNSTDCCGTSSATSIAQRLAQPTSSSVSSSSSTTYFTTSTHTTTSTTPATTSSSATSRTSSPSSSGQLRESDKSYVFKKEIPIEFYNRNQQHYPVAHSSSNTEHMKRKYIQYNRTELKLHSNPPWKASQNSTDPNQRKSKYCEWNVSRCLL